MHVIVNGYTVDSSSCFVRYDSWYSAVIQVCLIDVEELQNRYFVRQPRQQLYRDEMMTWNEIIKSSNNTNIIYTTTEIFYYSKVM